MEFHEISGRVSAGKGKSTRHMKGDIKLYEEVLGYEPVPGTMNLHTGKKTARLVSELPGGIPFEKDGKSRIYHEMFLNGMRVHVTAYRYSVEIVAEEYLRERFGFKDGDEVILTRY